MISVFKSNFKTYESLHHDAVIRYCNRPNNRTFVKSRMDRDILNSFGGIVKTLSELIKAAPEILFELKVYFDNQSPADQLSIQSNLDYEGLYNIFIKKDSLFRNNAGALYNSDELSKVIDISTCPYCNENTTYSFWHRKENITRRTFDWDHIISKDKYPFLAISFYNLVPACKVCNHLKLEKHINLSPHSQFNPDNNYSFQVTGASINFITDSKYLILLLKLKNGAASNAIKEVIDIISLETRLDAQKELIRDILNKKRIYQSSYWEGIENIVVAHNRVDVEELKKLFFSTYFNPDDYFRRPFSKLTHDLLIDKNS